MTGPSGTLTPDDINRRAPRRRFLRYALGGVVVVAAAGAVGSELVGHGVLPGKSVLDQLDGACDVAAPDFSLYAKPGPQYSGTFYSAARRTTVGYTVGYPPGHGPGDKLPLVIALHGFGDNHTDALSGITPSQAMALKPGGVPLPPMALVTVDGGGGYWNPHPRDNPQAMLTDELIPLCQRKGLGTGTRKIGVLGISMGGYGAILLAEQYPGLTAAVAAISPAIWTSYAQAKSANAGAYASAGDFARDDVVTHAAALAKTPVRIASGYDDPFYPGVQAFARALPRKPGGTPAEVYFGSGCHTGPFFKAQEPPSLAFLARRLTDLQNLKCQGPPWEIAAGLWRGGHGAGSAVAAAFRGQLSGASPDLGDSIPAVLEFLSARQPWRGRRHGACWRARRARTARWQARRAGPGRAGRGCRRVARSGPHGVARASPCLRR